MRISLKNFQQKPIDCVHYEKPILFKKTHLMKYELTGNFFEAVEEDVYVLEHASCPVQNARQTVMEATKDNLFHHLLSVI